MEEETTKHFRKEAESAIKGMLECIKIYDSEAEVCVDRFVNESVGVAIYGLQKVYPGGDQQGWTGPLRTRVSDEIYLYRKGQESLGKPIVTSQVVKGRMFPTSLAEDGRSFRYVQLTYKTEHNKAKREERAYDIEKGTTHLIEETG